MKTVVDLVTSLKTYFLGKDTDAKQAVEANIATVETDATSASKGYAVGDQLILEDVMYDVTTSISQGDALVVGTNISVASSITTQLKAKANTSSLATVATTGDYNDLINQPSGLTVDSAMSASSENPVQNKVIYSAVQDKQDKTLATARTIGGTSRTTVEDALGALTDANYLVSGLTSTSAVKALAANQGKALNDSITNKHKVTTLEVATSPSWGSESVGGVTYYTKTISLNNVYVDRPSVDIGTASGSVLPSAAEQTAYDLLKYVTVNGTTLKLYASAAPATSSNFYISVEGVD